MIVRKWQRLPQGLNILLVVGALCLTLFVGNTLYLTFASSCNPWYKCPISQYYGAPTEYGGEHGIDVLTHGLVITALLPGVITYVAEKYWDDPAIEDITWRLDHRTEGQPYAYVQIKANSQRVRVGQHISANTVLGTSWGFIEFGLSPDWAYGTSNWRWGANPLSVVRGA
jgi:hypothetical protein